MSAGAPKVAHRPGWGTMAPGRIAGAAFAVALALAARILAESPTAVEWHRTVVYPWFASLAQPISGARAGSLGEIVALTALALGLVALTRWRGRAVVLIIFALGLVVFSFYCSWGLAYRYPLLSARLAPFRADSDRADRARRLVDLTERTARILALASRGPLSLGGLEDTLLARINAALSEGLARLPISIDAAPVRGVEFGPVKLSRVSFALSRLRLSGYYLPWTGEAQINAEMPRTLWPRVAAHERAHQRGFARENEATVIGLLACLNSPDATVFYSGTLGLFAGFDRELARVDAEARRRIWAGLPPRVIDDFTREADFWTSHEGVTGEVSEKVNDMYLKAQGVRSGVGSYDETTLLLLQAIDTPGVGLGSLIGDGEASASPG